MIKRNWHVMWRLVISLLLAVMALNKAHPVAAKPSLIGPTNPQEVETFIDPLMADLMTENEAPGSRINLLNAVLDL